MSSASAEQTEHLTDGIRVLLSQNHRNPLYLEDDKSVCNLRSIGWADLRYNPNVKFTREKVRMLTKDLLKEPTERERSVHKRTPIPGTITGYANTKVSATSPRRSTAQ